VAFLGASMATHEKRHLTVDAVRKAVPAKHERWYNAVSYLVVPLPDSDGSVLGKTGTIGRERVRRRGLPEAGWP